MYTMYKNYKQLIKHLKHAKKIAIHGNVLPIAEKITTCRYVSMDAEFVNGDPVMFMTYRKPQCPVIGHAITASGVRFDVVGERHKEGGQAFWLIQGMHGIRGVLQSDVTFKVLPGEQLAYAA